MDQIIKNARILVIYHGKCADGFGAALAFYSDLGDDAEYYAASYDRPDECPDVTGRMVYMVDFCYAGPKMREIHQKAQNLVVLDHHKSAMENMLAEFVDARTIPQEKGVDISLSNDHHGMTEMFFRMDRSGAYLAWEFAQGSEDDIPKMIRHISDRDIWAFKLEHTRPFQDFLFSHEYDFEKWMQFLKDAEDPELFAKMVLEGEGIHRKMMKDIREVLPSVTTLREVEGHVVPFCNVPYFWASEALNLLARHFPFAVSYYDGVGWRNFSLRSRVDGGEDVSLIARTNGGGGHKNAAGMRIMFDANGKPVKDYPIVGNWADYMTEKYGPNYMNMLRGG